MKKSLLYFALLAPFASAQTTLIKTGKILDVTSGHYLHDHSIVIKDNIIEAVTTTPSITATQADQYIDLSTKTILPGLMDMHVHLSSNAEDNFFASKAYSIPRQTVIALANAQKTLAAGFTTVRDLGASGYSVIGLRDAIYAGTIVGPRIWASGYALGITGGHCDDNFNAPELDIEAAGVGNGPWELRAKARENIKYGANSLKMCATGGVFSKGTKVGAQQLAFEEMQAIVAEGKLRGLPVAAHAHGAAGMKAAIKAGVDSIEHCSFVDDEILQLAVANGTFFSCDIYNTEYTLAFGIANGVPKENIDKEKQVSEAQRLSFNRAVNAGVKMVFGSDAAIYPHGDNPKQFSRMVKFGMTPLQAIQAATINSAQLLKQDNLGQVKSGFLADIIALEGDPLQDISRIEKVNFVMVDGKVYKQESR
ncbi:amidohydrolase family protein [Paraferrimonas sp. SM1919]|uniref:Xaa-Pro dipeptidase n=1 Tax=Paraferrimonas sp. SM1919 TaxID=2662263 RepID=UPI00196A0744|nr:amidohydrolase family protein [Paraferrimonas sp. SM1919]